MLTADQISYLRDRSEQLLDPIIEFLVEDICKRVTAAGQFTSTASYQIWRAQNLGISQRKLKKEIAKRLKISQQQAEKLLTQSAEVGYNFDISRFPTSHAIPLSANSSLQQILSATVALAKDDLTNMTQTIGFVGTDGVCRELTDAYNQACDFAFQKISTGAQDYMSAIRDATKNLAEKGIRWIDYESGVHTSLEAAVRRNMMGALGLMQEQISQSNYDMLGCDGWEISAHEGSAPDHEPYQGKQYPNEAYKRLNNSLKRRIGTLNCGHYAFCIILGVNEPQYTDEELEAMRRRNEEGVTYEGKHYTLNEAQQKQRKFERTIRKQKRRILVDESLGDKERLQTDQIKLVRLQDEYIRFSKGTGQRTQYARMETEGFNWKHAKAAEQRYTERVAEVGEAAAAQNWHSIPVAGGKTDTMYRRITHNPQVGDNPVDATNQRIDRDVANTNPAFNSGNPGYKQNCQRCVAAYEMRRRGYDVIAKSAVVNENGLLSRKDPLYFKWDKIFSGARFLHCQGEDGGLEDIIAKMDIWGDGAVAEINVQWNATEAHVFIAERINGAVRFVDPQNGNTDCSSYFTNAINGATMVARIDNLEPTELIEKCIKNRGGKQ